MAFPSERELVQETAQGSHLFVGNCGRLLHAFGNDGEVSPRLVPTRNTMKKWGRV